MRHEKLTGSQSTPGSPSCNLTPWELIDGPAMVAFLGLALARKDSSILLPPVGPHVKIMTTEPVKLTLGLVQKHLKY